MAFSAIYFIQNDAATYRAFDSDGTEQYSGTSLVTDVLNAIETAHSSGNFMILFGVGTFDMSTENWTLNTVNDVTIAGAGIDITIIQNSSTAAADTEPFSFTNCDRITIRDLTVSAGGTARSTSDALDFDDGDECLVERVKITASRGDGIVFDGKDTGAQAINNIIRSCIITGADLCGIQLLAADRTLVEGNTIHANGECGIKLNRKTSVTVQSCQDTTIKNNRIYSNDESGIEVLEGDRSIIEGNIIFNNGQGAGTDDGVLIDDFATAGLTTDGNIVRNNQIYDDQGTPTQDYGVNVLDAAVTRTIVEGNIFDGHVTGAVNDVAVDTKIRNNLGHPDKQMLEVSGTYTLKLDDPPAINVDTSGGAGTINLPSVAAAEGRTFIIRRDGANSVTINRDGTDTFDDAATSKTLGADSSAIGIGSVADTEWKIVSTEGTVT